MKIFDKNEGWGSKVNFVDDHNVLLGYDLSQCCCESADWFITKTQRPTMKEYEALNKDLKGIEDFSFDRSFFRQEGSIDGENPLDAGEIATFRLHREGDEAFLHLFNCHNGYYSHGFTFAEGNEIIQEGSL